MRVLYLTSSIRSNGRNHLRGREFARQLRQEEELLLRHQLVVDRAAAVARDHALEQDLTDAHELAEFSPNVIFAEAGIVDEPGEWRIPLKWLLPYIEGGGVLVIEGADEGRLEAMSPEDRRAMLNLAGASLTEGHDARFPGHLYDEISNGGHATLVACHPDRMHVSGWLRPTYQGIDAVVASLATPLFTMGSLLATTDGTARLLILDRFVSGPREFPWATVRQLGYGFVALIAATVAHDFVVAEHPDNSRWLSNLLRHLVDEAERERSLYVQPGRTASNLVDVDVDALVEGGESHAVEFKECALRERVMQEEVALTVAAFANAQGGTLLVGVADDGRVIGIDDEIGHAGSADTYLRRIIQLLHNRLDPKPIGGSVLLSLFEVEQRTVLVFRIAKSATPVWVTQKGGSEPAFYVRANSTSQKLGARAASDYIADDFPRR